MSRIGATVIAYALVATGCDQAPGVGAGLNDPRFDPESARRLLELAGSDPWDVHYAEWVEIAALARSIGSDPRAAPGPDPAINPLVVDLMGATLVDPHAELRAAWGEATREALSARPPWPPASIQHLLADEASPEDRRLLEVLIRTMVPDDRVGTWLLNHWRTTPPGHRVDARILDELASAMDGGLLAEPRFRAWLRREWCAWARQSYLAALAPAS